MLISCDMLDEDYQIRSTILTENTNRVTPRANMERTKNLNMNSPRYNSFTTSAQWILEIWMWNVHAAKVMTIKTMVWQDFWHLNKYNIACFTHKHVLLQLWFNNLSCRPFYTKLSLFKCLLLISKFRAFQAKCSSMSRIKL